jgi:hypothetical protein
MIFLRRPALQQHPAMVIDDADGHGAVKVAEAMGGQFVGATNLPVVPINKDHLFKPVIHGGALHPEKRSSSSGLS